MKISRAQTAVGLALSLGVACTSLAAPERPGQLEEVIVTAQKRAQRLSDVGIAVTALSEEQIRKLGFTRSVDIAAHSPGVFISADLGGQNQRFTIRGVGQNDFLDALEAPVAIYVDEGYISAQQGQAFGLFDMERIEVLRGPQGTLFGRNATGGLVHYITRQPELGGATEGYAELTLGSNEQVIAEAAFGGSLSDSAAARVAIRYSRHDGIFKNDFAGGPRFSLDVSPGVREDLYNDDSIAGRAHFLFGSTEGTQVLLTADASRVRIGSGAYEQRAIIAELDSLGRHINTFAAAPDETREAIGPGGVGVPIIALDGEFPVEAGLPAPPEDNRRPLPGGDLFGYRDTKLGDFHGSLDWASDDINKYDSAGLRAKITRNLSANVTFTSITDFKDYDKVASLDVDAGPSDQLYYFDDAQTRTLAEEIRLNGTSDRVDWVTGAYFLKIDNDTLTGLAFLGTSPFAFFPPPNGLDSNPLDATPGPGVKLMDEVALETRSASVFGQIDYALTDRLKLILGARAIREEKEYSFAQNSYVNDNPTVAGRDFFGVVLPQPAGSNPYRNKTGDTLWAGKAQIDWRQSEDLLVYAGVNRGVKAGSFNAPLPDGNQVPAEDLSYDEEVLLAYETGFKRSFANDRVRLNGSIFFYDYQDYQAFTFTNVSGVISNEDATVKGLEFEFAANPSSQLALQLSASYTDAKVKDVEVARGIFADVEPTFTPEWLISGLARYAWNVRNGELALQMDGNYVDDRWANLRNFAAHRMDSYFVGNVRLFWESLTGRWQASMFVTNVADEKVVTERFDLATLCGCEDVHYASPRWYGATVRYSFQ